MDGLLQTLSTLGLGGVFAGVMVHLYRETVKNHREDNNHYIEQIREDRKFMEDRLTTILSEYNQKCDGMTDALRELTVWLKARNGHS